MQIEEAFRDLRSSRYGLSLYQNGTYKIERLRVLIMIGSLTTAFAWLLGKATEIAGKHRMFQANTVSHTKSYRLSLSASVYFEIGVFDYLCNICLALWINYLYSFKAMLMRPSTANFREDISGTVTYYYIVVQSKLLHLHCKIQVI